MANAVNEPRRGDPCVASAVPAERRVDSAWDSTTSTDQSDVILRLQSVTREIAGRNLLVDVSFDLRLGDVVAVLGPSGAGKTSLLRMIAGLDAPTGGILVGTHLPEHPRQQQEDDQEHHDSQGDVHQDLTYYHEFPSSANLSTCSSRAVPWGPFLHVPG